MEYWFEVVVTADEEPAAHSGIYSFSERFGSLTDVEDGGSEDVDDHCKGNGIESHDRISRKKI